MKFYMLLKILDIETNDLFKIVLPESDLTVVDDQSKLKEIFEKQHQRPATADFRVVLSRGNQVLEYNYFNDGGHGWLEVQKDFLKHVGVWPEISQSSKECGRLAYLEHDSDMDKFCKAVCGHYGLPESPEVLRVIFDITSFETSKTGDGMDVRSMHPINN